MINQVVLPHDNSSLEKNYGDDDEIHHDDDDNRKVEELKEYNYSAHDNFHIDDIMEMKKPKK